MLAVRLHFVLVLAKLVIPEIPIRSRIPIPGIRIPVEKNMVTMQRLFVFMSMTVIGQKKDLFLVRHLSGRYQREILLKQI